MKLRTLLEDTDYAATLEPPNILWNPKVHFPLIQRLTLDLKKGTQQSMCLQPLN
jgi:hypothetical protein